MLKQRSHMPAGWAGKVIKCGAVALGAALSTAAVGLTGAAAATAAPAATPVHGTITGNGVNVRALASLKGAVLYQLNKGASVNVYCHLNGDGVLWDRIKLSPQEWVAANYVNVGGAAIPTCVSLGLGNGEDGGMTGPAGGTKISIHVGPIIVSNSNNTGASAAK